ncbi:MAG: hypothetical protein H6641_07585 [Caldilineaceae bacterium]|nr:hypothetical protein [Caldilineaceae bacterium]
MYTVGNPLNANDPSGHSQCLDCVGGGAFSGGFATQSAYIAARRALITVGAGGAGYAAGEVIKELNADEAQESFPLPDNQPTVLGTPLEGHDSWTYVTEPTDAPGSQATGFPLVQQQVGDNVVYSNHEVYIVRDPKTGAVEIYVGRTNQGLSSREKQHRKVSGRETWELELVKTGLTYDQARELEQELIMQYGLDNLENQRNEIARSKWSDYLKGIYDQLKGEQ